MQIKPISYAETVEMIKAELRRTFPGVRFWVCKESSAWVGISWCFGPSTADVRAAVGHFRGERFDGSTDRTESRLHVVTDVSGVVCNHSYGVTGIDYRRKI